MNPKDGQQSRPQQSSQYPQFDPSQRLPPHGFNAPQLENPQLQVSHMSDARFSKLSKPQQPRPFPSRDDQSNPTAAVEAASNAPEASSSGRQRSSIVETPIEMQTPTFPSTRQRPSEPSIPQSPRSPAQEVLQDASPVADAMGSPDRTTSPYRIPPPMDDHPALSAPYGDSDAIAPRRISHPASSTGGEKGVPQGPGRDLPKSQTGGAGTAPGGDHKDRPDADTRTSRVPTYNPNSALGPDHIVPGAHQPGQATHPNMAPASPAWRHSLCGCCGDVPICCQGCWCPCILYGKTQYRLNRKATGHDATDLLGYKSVNGACGLLTVACGFQWLLTFFQHSRIRSMYDLEGSVAKDCLASYCCYSCMLMQDEREVKDREEDLRSLSRPLPAGGGGDVVASAYVPPPDMTYTRQ